MQKNILIAVVQFPGSNTERETVLAIQRAGMTAVEFLWNEPYEKLESCAGYVIIGGFSYEDRSRAGIIASLDPLMKVIRRESENGKLVLGICNGAQILVESGLVPGLANYQIGMALTNNKRLKKNGHVLGTGYYNAWTNLKLAVSPKRTAFTCSMKTGDCINVPFAHAEGRFVIPDKLLNELRNNNQVVFRYCDDDGNFIPEFPINPNGSVHNMAAVSNPAGNIMAIMPHPERTPKGDVIFASMREYIEQQPKLDNRHLDFRRESYAIHSYQKDSSSFEWIIDLIITDNEAVSVHNALAHLDIPVTVSRQTHWEIVTTDSNVDLIKQQLIDSGELFNSNKEVITEHQRLNKSASFLIRHNDDLVGRQKLETLRDRFEISRIRQIYKGVLWNITAAGNNFEHNIKRVLDTHILFNPVSHDCYRYL